MRVIDYFFDEEEKELVEDYKKLIKIVATSIVIGLIVIVL
jgi:hypothetical protein